jgi:hypothetical protein
MTSTRAGVSGKKRRQAAALQEDRNACPTLGDALRFQLILGRDLRERDIGQRIAVLAPSIEATLQRADALNPLPS